MEQEKVQYTPEEINLLQKIKDEGVPDDIPMSMDKMEQFLHKTDILPEWVIYSRLADTWKVADSEGIQKIIVALEDLENKMKKKAESILDELNIDRGQEKIGYSWEDITLLREIAKGGAGISSIDMDWDDATKEWSNPIIEHFLDKFNLMEDWTEYHYFEKRNEMGLGRNEIDEVLQNMDKYDEIVKEKAGAILDDFNVSREQGLIPPDIELLHKMMANSPRIIPTLDKHFDFNQRQTDAFVERVGIANEYYTIHDLWANLEENHHIKSTSGYSELSENRIKEMNDEIDSIQEQIVDKIEAILTIKNEDIMEENVNDKLPDPEVLLVKEKDSNDVKVVQGVDKDGKVVTTENEADFLKIDKNGNMLENFWQNYKRQYDNPTEFFQAPLNMVSALVKNLDALAKFKIDVPKKEHAISADSVNWDKFKELGISKEYLEFKGKDDTMSNLDRLLNYQRTNLVPVSLKVEGESHKLPTSARISLRKEENGTFSPKLLLWKQKPDLKEYRGVKFTDEDRENLQKYGNLGRIVEAEFSPGVKTPVLVTLDKQTNQLLSCRASDLRVPDTYKGVTLSDEQKRDLGLGKRVEVKDMISTNPKTKGQKFTGYVQFNADKRYFELSFDEKKQSQSQKQGNEQREVPKTFRKVELTEEQRSSLSEGKTVYIDGLIDKKDRPYSGYITWNKETGKLDFMFKNQYEEALKAGKVIPDDRHKTQVAVNSEGKTNEATKNANEPMENGQTQPTEAQVKKEVEKEEKKQDENKNKKSRGIR